MDSYGQAAEVEKVKARRRPVDRDIVEALDVIAQETQRARDQHGHFNSAHEGYAVILEELDELWEQTRRRKALRNGTAMRLEACQIAAMAIKFLCDVGRFVVPEEPTP